MGLITKEVEVYVSGKTYKHYENLGYKFPRKPNGKCDLTIPFKVKVEDLTPKSGAKVELECDSCGKVSTSKYCDYVNHNHNGKTYCHKCSQKLFNSGENNFNWNPNKTQEEREKGRLYPEYTEFIRRVLARDNYTCQCCGKQHANLEVHHLDGYNWCIEKRTDDTNGITLCSSCHSNFHSTYGNKHSTKEEFEEWFGKSIELVKCGIKILPCKQVYCIEADTVYDSVNNVCKQLGIKHSHRVYAVCNKKAKNKSVNNYHFLWYEEYTNMTQQEIDDYMEFCKHKSNSKKIICLETLEIFDKLADAGRAYSNGKNGSSQIIRACENFGHTAYSLKDGTLLHWMYYDEFLNSSKEYIEKWKSTFLSTRKIICLNTKKVYNNTVEIMNDYNIKRNTILDNCHGKTKSGGKLPDGTPLCWMYYDEYLKLIAQGVEPELYKNITWVKVICVTTGKVFDKVKDACEYYNTHSGTIAKCCRGEAKNAGKLPDGTKLQWMYYSDFLQLPQQEQDKILNKKGETNE